MNRLIGTRFLQLARSSAGRESSTTSRQNYFGAGWEPGRAAGPETIRPASVVVVGRFDDPGTFEPDDGAEKGPRSNMAVELADPIQKRHDAERSLLERDEHPGGGSAEPAHPITHLNQR